MFAKETELDWEGAVPSKHSCGILDLNICDFRSVTLTFNLEEELTTVLVSNRWTPDFIEQSYLRTFFSLALQIASIAVCLFSIHGMDLE